MWGTYRKCPLLLKHCSGHWSLPNPCRSVIRCLDFNRFIHSEAASAFLDLGVRRLTPTFDLDAVQMCAIAAALPPAQRVLLHVLCLFNGIEV